MKKLKTFLAIILSISSLTAGPVPGFPHLSVSATALKSVVPDEAIINFTVLSFKASSEAAVNEVNQTLAATVAKLLTLGIKKDDITADDLEKSITRERNDDYQKLKILGYQIERTVEVKITNLKLYNQAATLIFKSNLITNVRSRFGNTKEDDILLALYAEACAKAKKKAAALEQAAGVKIKSIHAISPGRGNYHFQYLGDPSYGMVMSAASDSSQLPGLGGETGPPLFVPKEISLDTSVSILFRLAE